VRAIEDTVEVGVNLRFPILRLRIDEPAIDADARIFEQQVEPAEAFTHLIEQCLDLLLIADVRCDSDPPAAEPFDQRIHPLLASSGENHIDALLREQPSRGLPDAARRTRTLPVRSCIFILCHTRPNRGG
jgi:hypothetical protein